LSRRLDILLAHDLKEGEKKGTTTTVNFVFQGRQILRANARPADADLSFEGPRAGELRGRVAVDAVVAQVCRLFALAVPVPVSVWRMDGWTTSDVWDLGAAKDVDRAEGGRKRG
jgi:hypothetical protein